MDSLEINTGEKRIAINGDPARILVFNPSDVAFAERFYNLMGDFQQKLTEYQTRVQEFEKDTAIDANGVPVNLKQQLVFANEACEYICNQIDHLFGKGTTQIVFGDARTLEMFEQFFNGLMPYISKARAEKVAKYTNKRPKRVMK